MSRISGSLLAAAAFLAFQASSANAASVSVGFDTGVVYETQIGVRENTGTWGSDLDGATVIVTYADGGTEELTWAKHPTEDYYGSVSSANMSMWTYGWDGFTLTASRLLASITMNLLPASSLFDAGTAHEWEEGNTTTTHVGYYYETLGGDPLEGDISVIYSNAIQLAGEALKGDAYTTMTVDYTGLVGGGLLGSTLFLTDMDTLEVAGDLQAVSPVPLPAGMILLLSGLGMLGLRRRRG